MFAFVDLKAVVISTGFDGRFNKKKTHNEA